MDKLLFTIFCVLNLLIINEAVESGPKQAYDLNSLFTNAFNRYEHSHNLITQSASALQDLDLQFRAVNWDFDFQSLQHLALNSSKCAGDILFTLLSLDEMWALGMLDSFGKPGSGILQGNTKFLGDYNECIGVRSVYSNTTVGNFRGKYCSLSVNLDIHFMNKTIPFPLTVGICVPDSCSASDIQEILNATTNFTDTIPVLNGTKLSTTCKPTERSLNAPAQGVIGLLSIFCLLALIGSSITVVEYIQKIIQESSRKRESLIVNVSEGGDPNKAVVEDDASLLQGNTLEKNYASSQLKAFLRCFCVFTNGAKLLNTDSSEGQLLCIHGIRFLSMSWVILGHTYAFVFTETANLLDFIKASDNFAFQAVLQGFYSVDSFFVLSGFLLSYLSMKEFSKTKGVISWPYFYIHRYIRLTPIYMVVLGFSATLYFYLGSGPFWPENDTDPICTEYWWWNLLYINNFNKMTATCMGWSWYLANDMQFFVISPLFLIALWRWPKVGYALLGTFLAASWLSNFVITYHFELLAGLGDATGKLLAGNIISTMERYYMYFDKIYTKPYTRISPYLIGMLVGYLLFRRHASDKPKHSLLFLLGGWMVATAISLVAVYGLYHNHPSLIGASFYNAFHRTTFALGLCWVIYVCLVGQGGPVNSILSYKLFIPLSRLTYAAYLIHPMIINGYYLSLKASFVFSQSTMVMLFLGIMLATYGLALPVALVLESPIVSLEKVLRKSFSKKD